MRKPGKSSRRSPTSKSASCRARRSSKWCSTARASSEPAISSASADGVNIQGALMFEPKPISRDAIPAALAKAERYRLLNEPLEAESICLDVLQIDGANQDAIVMLLLALT